MLDETMMPSLVKGMPSTSASGKGMLVTSDKTSNAFSSVTDMPMLGILAEKLKIKLGFQMRRGSNIDVCTMNSGLREAWVIVNDTHISRDLQ